MTSVHSSFDYLAQLAFGKKHSAPKLDGSGDAWWLAQLAQCAHAQKKLVVMVTPNAVDIARLVEEIKYFAPELVVKPFPDWETLPYDNFSPHQDLVSERLEALYHLIAGDCDVLLLGAPTALQRIAPADYVAGRTLFFKVGSKLNAEALKNQLHIAGYSPVTQVMVPGEYAVRGGLIDLFPTGSVVPYRLDLFGDEIDSIKTFDVDTQRTLYPVQQVRLLPGREFPFDEAARTAFRNRFREVFEGDPSRSRLYKDAANGIAHAGIEYYLPLFFEHTATLFDYLKPNTVLILPEELDAAMRSFTREANERFAFLSQDSEKPILPLSALYLSNEEFFVLAQSYTRIALSSNASERSPTLPAPEVAVNRKAADPFSALKNLIENEAQHAAPSQILLLAESPGRRETILQSLAEYGLVPNSTESFSDFLNQSQPLMLGVAPLAHGFVLRAEDESIGKRIILTETELYAHSPRRSGKQGKRQEKATSVDAMVRDLSELRIGDPVVHAAHGIGRYLGLLELDMGHGISEFLHLEYADHTKLYVPVHQLQQISRYAGTDAESAPLHNLGSGQWDKARRKAAQQVRDTAAELLNLYARRALRHGHTFEYSMHDYEAFAEGFGFEETADQEAAIHAVIKDMSSGKAMDRLVCGDVGFGKTEVALRAAFVAVMGGKQVAILCPTTLLAEQHFNTFSDRFAQWPVKLAEMSRFKTAKEIKMAIEGLANGTIDILIGTHKLLSADVKFDRLGLVIIDEEHRFGVRQKEALKALRAEVDVLTLTATPIPRTLGLALEGMRDFSVIATAPQKRLAIKTFLRREENGVIREAVLRELKRGGQVYYLHNEVATIENRRLQLEALLPEARIVVAHGQMHERELERVMRDFVHQRYNVLLCSTIIETGIDVPTANTIIIHRADRFGLAQLHQLRGRVGRSHHQAYAYLLVDNVQGLPKQAQLRLDAIVQMEDLGGGFYLAMHDMEIRGAGEVLGDKQSGDMLAIGFALYSDMLNAAIKSLKEGREPDLSAPLSATTEINLHTPALLPSDYCGDVHERLTLYKRLASCEQLDDLIDLQEELIDRFGKLPDAARALIETHRLRLLATPFGVSKIDAHDEMITLQFSQHAPIDPAKVIALVQKNRHIKLNGPNKLRIEQKTQDLAARVLTIKNTLSALST